MQPYPYQLFQDSDTWIQLLSNLQYEREGHQYEREALQYEREANKNLEKVQYERGALQYEREGNEKFSTKGKPFSTNCVFPFYCNLFCCQGNISLNFTFKTQKGECFLSNEPNHANFEQKLRILEHTSKYTNSNQHPILFFGSFHIFTLLFGAYLIIRV